MSGKLWNQKTGRTARIVMSLMFGLLCIPDIGQADGYVNTMNIMNRIRVQALERADYVKEFCETTTDRDTTFNQNSIANISPYFAKRYPGSKINCQNSSGTWLDGLNTYYLDNGNVYKHVVVGDNGLIYEANFAPQFTFTRVSDVQGNYVQIKASIDNPNDCMYLEAKLPINVQDGGVISGQDKGNQYSSDELVAGMNEVYKRYLNRHPDGNLPAWANALLLNREERVGFMERARKIMGEPKTQK